MDTDQMMGNLELRLRHLDGLGKKGLYLDASKMADVDTKTPSIAFRDDNYILDRLHEELGPPITILDKLDPFASKLLKKVKRRFLGD